MRKWTTGAVKNMMCAKEGRGKHRTVSSDNETQYHTCVTVLNDNFLAVCMSEVKRFHQQEPGYAEEGDQQKDGLHTTLTRIHGLINSS